MYHIQSSSAFRAICPQFAGRAIYAEITNSETSPELWAEIEEEVARLRQHYTTESIKHRTGIAATRAAYKAAGKDPSRYRPACEQLARRVLQGKSLYAVNTVVDLVNLQPRLPVQWLLHSSSQCRLHRGRHHRTGFRTSQRTV